MSLRTSLLVKKFSLEAASVGLEERILSHSFNSGKGTSRANMMLLMLAFAAQLISGLPGMISCLKHKLDLLNLSDILLANDLLKYDVIQCSTLAVVR